MDKRSGVWLIRAEGELDAYTSDDLRGALADVGLESAGKVLVDLSRVSYIDSTALGVLVGAYKQLNEVGGRMGVCGGPPHVRKVFQISGIEQLMPVYADESAGLGALQEAPDAKGAGSDA